MADKEKTLGKTVLGWFVVRPEDEEAATGAPSTPPGPAGQKPGATGDAVADDLIARYAGGGASPKTRPPKAPPGAPGPGAPPQAQARPGKAPPPGAPNAAAKTLVGGSPSTATPLSAPPPGMPALAVTPAELNFPEIYKKYGLSAEDQGRVERALQLLHNLPRETPRETKRQIVEASLAAFGFPVDQIIEAAALHHKALDRHVDKGQKETQALLEESNLHLQQLEKEAERVRQIMQEALVSQQALAAACTGQKHTVQEVLDFFGPEAVERVRASSVKLRDP